MRIADSFIVLLVAIGFAVGFLGWWSISYALWRDKVREAADCLGTGGLLKPFLWGLIPTVLAVFVVGAISSAGGPAAGVGLALATFLLLFAHRGVAGLALHVGRRITEGGEGRAVFRGGLALCGAIAFPLLGWIGLSLFFTILGFGLWVTGLLATRSVPPPVPATPPAVGEVGAES